jgi:hypothetical protein
MMSRDSCDSDRRCGRIRQHDDGSAACTEAAETRMAQGLALVHQGDGRHPRSAIVARPLMEGKRATVAPGGWLRDTLMRGRWPVDPLQTARRPPPGKGLGRRRRCWVSRGAAVTQARAKDLLDQTVMKRLLDAGRQDRHSNRDGSRSRTTLPALVNVASRAALCVA